MSGGPPLAGQALEAHDQDTGAMNGKSTCGHGAIKTQPTPSGVFIRSPLFQVSISSGTKSYQTHSTLPALGPQALWLQEEVWGQRGAVRMFTISPRCVVCLEAPPTAALSGLGVVMLWLTQPC